MPTWSHVWPPDEPQSSSNKRKLDDEAVTKKEITEPVLYVSGCSNIQNFSNMLKGQYTAKRWHHGKPVYEKEASFGCDRPVVLYFWDDQWGERYHGWWFSPRESSSEVLAYNSSNLDPDDLTVPKCGWKVPCNGVVDLSLRITRITLITAHQASSVHGDNAPFELRWEFDAGADGEKQDWQPMKKDMNDALEKRWKKGWQGDNGLDIFYVQTGRVTYGIDCDSMVQWNQRTQRSRQIRRGEARPDVTVLLSKLAEKESQVEQLQTERNGVVEEKKKLQTDMNNLVEDKKELQNERDLIEGDRNSLVQEKKELMESIRKLEQEKRALENRQSDHAAQMMLQEAWRMSRQMQTNICRELPTWDAAFSQIRQALVEACPLDHHGACKRVLHVRILGLQQVYNGGLWKDYEFRKEQVRKELEGRDSIPIVNSNLPSQVCRWAQLDGKINEVLLLHGTTVDKIDQIANFGFDERLARESGLYGQGVYFTDQSCKSFQYSGAPWQDSGCFIIARVILGHPYYAPGPLKQLKVEPMVDSNEPSKGRCHSVIAQPGTPTKGQKQVHREFVLFNGAQAYPEMIVHFKPS